MTDHFPPLYLAESVSLVAGKWFPSTFKNSRILEYCFQTLDPCQTPSTMPHARQLTTEERRIILNMLEADYDISDIADAVGRSRGTVYNVKKNPTKLCASPRSGRPLSISESSFRRMMRKARTGLATARMVKTASNCLLSLCRVRHYLRNDENLAYRRMRRAPAMTQLHRDNRVQWATVNLAMNQEYWAKVIWSDEKKFTLTGPDGMAYYWHDKRCQERIFHKKHSGGGSVMVWGCYSASGKCTLAFIEERLNATKYCEVLEEHLLPFAYSQHGTEEDSFFFMQDGARAHTANITKQWLQSLEINVIDWPAVSPDLNPIENLWGILTQRVYPNSFQFETKEGLKQAIQSAWDGITLNELQTLSSSLPSRCAKVITSRGHTIDY